MTWRLKYFAYHWRHSTKTRLHCRLQIQLCSWWNYQGFELHVRAVLMVHMADVSFVAKGFASSKCCRFWVALRGKRRWTNISSWRSFVRNGTMQSTNWMVSSLHALTSRDGGISFAMTNWKESCISTGDVYTPWVWHELEFKSSFEPTNLSLQGSFGVFAGSKLSAFPMLGRQNLDPSLVLIDSIQSTHGYILGWSQTIEKVTQIDKEQLLHSTVCNLFLDLAHSSCLQVLWLISRLTIPAGGLSILPADS